MSDTQPVMTFTNLLGQSLTVAVLLFPVIAWYEWLKVVTAGTLGADNSATALFWKALILTVIVAVIIYLFRRWGAPSNGVVVAPVGSV